MAAVCSERPSPTVPFISHRHHATQHPYQFCARAARQCIPAAFPPFSHPSCVPHPPNPERKSIKGEGSSRARAPGPLPPSAGVSSFLFFVVSCLAIPPSPCCRRDSPPPKTTVVDYIFAPLQWPPAAPWRRRFAAVQKFGPRLQQARATLTHTLCVVFCFPRLSLTISLF